mgnify:CR=1 FL=1
MNMLGVARWFAARPVEYTRLSQLLSTFPTTTNDRTNTMLLMAEAQAMVWSVYRVNDTWDCCRGEYHETLPEARETYLKAIEPHRERIKTAPAWRVGVSPAGSPPDRLNRHVRISTEVHPHDIVGTRAPTDSVHYQDQPIPRGTT